LRREGVGLRKALDPSDSLPFEATQRRGVTLINGNKVKLSLCLTDCLEDVWASGCIDPQLEVSNELHAPAALLLVPIGQEAGRAPEPVWTI
jgi:hypothetical protein